MVRDRVRGTEGYAQEAEQLIQQYEGVPFAELHRQVLHLVPASPCRILDIGAGTGRDAARFAEMGHRVVAVEPTAKLRQAAMALHPCDRIEWLDDSLPELRRLQACNAFGVIMLTAVWMHLDEIERRTGMPRLAELTSPGGVVIMSLRHGPVPAGRRMFEVSAEETSLLAAAAGLRPILRLDCEDGFFRRPGVSWTRLAFCRD